MKHDMFFTRGSYFQRGSATNPFGLLLKSKDLQKDRVINHIVETNIPSREIFINTGLN